MLKMLIIEDFYYSSFIIITIIAGFYIEYCLKAEIMYLMRLKGRLPLWLCTAQVTIKMAMVHAERNRY
jgi:hypothetical protein